MSLGTELSMSTGYDFITSGPAPFPFGHGDLSAYRETPRSRKDTGNLICWKSAKNIMLVAQHEKSTTLAVYLST